MARPATRTCLFVLLVLMKDVVMVKIKMLNVPTKAREGEDLNLTCVYDLEGQSLYSLNWWKDNLQFYNYSPTNSPSKTVYETSGVDVITHRSNSQSVHLRNTTLKTSGAFRCEVIAEFPTYERDSATALMEIVEVPKTPPIISVKKLEYMVGEVIEANCTSLGTRPPSQLFWYLNGNKVHSRHWQTPATGDSDDWSNNVLEDRPGVINIGEVDNFYLMRMSRTTMPPIVSNIKLVLFQRHFIRGRFTLTCSAVLANLYNRDTSVQITLPGVLSAESFQRKSSATNTLSSIMVYMLLALMAIF